MNDNQKAAPTTSTARFAFRMYFYGIASTLFIMSVLYRHVPVAELTEPVRIIGLALFIGGWFLGGAPPDNALKNGPQPLC